MDIIFIPLLSVLNLVIGLYVWVVIGSVVMSWLISFNVVNPTNNLVIMVREFLMRGTDPVFRSLRNILPATGAMDFAPLVVLLAAWFLQAVIGQLMVKMVMG